MDAGDATNDSSHRELAAFVREEDFADVRASIEPALEDSQVFHCFER
jgi:hypothetical protein